MSKSVIKNELIKATVVGLVLAGAAMPVFASPPPPTQAEAFGYLQWLHSLETEVTARTEAGLGEATFMFPFDLPAWDLDDPRPYRHLSISKAVTELETARSRGETGELRSALMALANARNYTNLSEYDSAMVWYEAAAALDSAGSFRHEISREKLACAISLRDTLKVAEMTTNLLGASDLDGRADELVLTYRWVLTLQDKEAASHLSQKLSSHPSVVDSRLRFWRAYGLQWLGEREESLAELRTLILDGGLSNGLTEGQRGWVIQSIADNYFFMGDHKVARELYQTLSGCGVPDLRFWGKYQLAGLDFIAARYLSASNGFEQVCAASRFGSWQDQACAMAEIAKEMVQVAGEGEPYGIASFYGP